MAQFGGFISDKLEIKFLILYIAARLIEPVPFEMLQDLAMCDEGVDYFDFSQCLADLVRTEHLTCQNDLYAITAKGRENSKICESSLPYSVRMHCDDNLVKLNAVLRRAALVQTDLTPNGDGTCQARLYLADDSGPLMELKVLYPSLDQGQDLIRRFQEAPEALYHQIMGLLASKDLNDGGSET